jgi:iron complex transport system substrate-binding protein
MKRLGLILCILILVPFCVSLSSCNESEAEGKYITFSDSAGNVISLDERPSRVAVLFSSFAEIWTLSGGEVYATVYESVERGIVPEGTNLVDSGAGKTVNTELLISLQPDLVIASYDIPAQVKCASALREADIPCALMRVESFDDYLNMLNICTDITGNRDAYKKYGTDVKKEIDNILSSVPKNQEKPKILFIRGGSTPRSVKAKNHENNFVCYMLKELNTCNIADNAPLLLDGLSLEAILTEDPCMIFLSTMGDEAAARQNLDAIMSSDGYASLSAVKNGRVYYLPKDMFQYKPNAKWAEAYQYLSEIIYESN